MAISTKKIPIKKLKNDFELPIYGLGTWFMGGTYEKDTTNDEASVAAIRMAFDKGVRHIDTAEMYGGGHAEELIATAIEGTIDRRELFLVTKVSPENLRYDDVLKSCENSLRRLNTDYIDLYLIHRPPAGLPSPVRLALPAGLPLPVRLAPPVGGIDIRDTMRAMDELVRRGLVKNLGVCNMTPHRYDQIQNLTSHKIVCNQIHYNVMMREAEEYSLPQHAIERDYFITAWRPLQVCYDVKYKHDSKELEYPKIIQQMANKYGKTPNQIAINWLVSQPNVVVISKTGTPAHLDENLGALGWTMDLEDVETLRRDYPNKQFLSNSVPLNSESSMPVC